ncbi:hypothetical protein ROA7450_01570 [Roseovarius albus]|uniref:Uncharacterized protein n=1 Tax=Roseovarius albus TaxID=1247867 RepID=A0A1X6Z042_9RHOB|nr:hypothetical protein ROA7450_01570 [Roseovarius albus]
MGLKRHVGTLDPACYILVPVLCAILANFFVDLGIAVIGTSIFTKFATGGFLMTNMGTYQQA